MKRGPVRVLVLGVTLALLLALAACGGGGSPYGGGGGTPAPSGGGTSGGNTITLQNSQFNPSSLSVKTGDTVTFTNADSYAHQIVVGDQDLGQQGQGESKTWKAAKAGAFPMKCLIHPSMTGQITVK